MIAKETNPLRDAGFCIDILNDSGFPQYSYATILVIFTELIGELHIWILLDLRDFVAGSRGHHPEPTIQMYQCHRPYSWSHPIEGGQRNKLSFLKLIQYPPYVIACASHFLSFFEFESHR
jgi:hypothetical protein